jgi:hypothetical protein
VEKMLLSFSIHSLFTAVKLEETLPTIDFPSPQQVALVFWMLIGIAYALIMLYAIYGATKK